MIVPWKVKHISYGKTWLVDSVCQNIDELLWRQVLWPRCDMIVATYSHGTKPNINKLCDKIRLDIKLIWIKLEILQE